MTETVILIDNISKKYQLGVIGTGTFYGDVKRKWAKMRGQPDPFLKIGEADHGNRSGETVWALKDINIEVQRGEVLGIIGRNGAGKSTLLKILSQVTTPTTGVVNVKGRIASLLEVGTGFHPELTGRENIFLNGAIMGMDRAEIKRKLDEIIAFSGVEQYIDTPVKRYSSGMYVRLAFAVAAHLDPDILILDEVLAVGDLAFQEKSLGRVQDISTSGRTVLLVSHNMHMVKRFCSRAVLLDGGIVKQEGNVDDCISTYLGRHFMKNLETTKPSNPSKPMSLLSVRITDKKGDTLLDVDFTSGFNIEIEYEVNVETSFASVWFDVRSYDDTIAFVSADTDMEPKLMEKRTPGKYRTVLNVPEKWLNAGKYKLVIGIQQYSPSETYDRIEDFFFTINEVGTPENIRTGFSRQGFFQPFFNWNTKKI